MHCQLCLMEFDALGNHPQNNCPVYTQQPVAGVSSYNTDSHTLDIQRRLERIEALLREILDRMS